ncbi:BTB/POZ protein [Xylariales sp. AK1849]|nr:BTB/POZ protein [Xylariales sp. AK1849]
MAFIANDRDLFETGFLADAVVKCHGKEWEVHKVILSSRSDWFRKAFCGKFKEAETGEVVLHEGDSEAVGAIIYWIYTGDSTAFDGTENSYAKYSKLYECADFFGLDQLMQDIMTSLSQHLREDAIEVQKRFCQAKAALSPNTTNLLPQNTIQRFKLGVEAAYNSSSDKLRGEYVKFVMATHWWILNDANFQHVLRDVHGFAFDLLSFTIEASGAGVYVPNECPLTCWDCGEQCFTRGDVERYWVKVWVIPDIQGACNKCNAHWDIWICDKAWIRA